MILVAQLCDVLDGRIARLTRTTSSFGIAVRLARRPGRVRRRARHPRLHVGARARGGAGAGSRRRSTSPAARSAWRASTCRSHRSRSGTSSACRSRPRPTSIAATVLLYYYLGGEGATNKHIIMLLVIYARGGAHGERGPLLLFKEIASIAAIRSGCCSALIVAADAHDRRARGRCCSSASPATRSPGPVVALVRALRAAPASARRPRPTRRREPRRRARRRA